MFTLSDKDIYKEHKSQHLLSCLKLSLLVWYVAGINSGAQHSRTAASNQFMFLQSSRRSHTQMEMSKNCNIGRSPTMYSLLERDSPRGIKNKPYF